jgi:hypothetical protein
MFSGNRRLLHVETQLTSAVDRDSSVIWDEINALPLRIDTGNIIYALPVFMVVPVPVCQE